MRGKSPYLIGRNVIHIVAAGLVGTFTSIPIWVIFAGTVVLGAANTLIGLQLPTIQKLLTAPVKNKSEFFETFFVGVVTILFIPVLIIVMIVAGIKYVVQGIWDFIKLPMSSTKEKEEEAAAREARKQEILDLVKSYAGRE